MKFKFYYGPEDNEQEYVRELDNDQETKVLNRIKADLKKDFANGWELIEKLGLQSTFDESYKDASIDDVFDEVRFDDAFDTYIEDFLNDVIEEVCGNELRQEEFDDIADSKEIEYLRTCAL